LAATTSARAEEASSPPWRALTSAKAALDVAFGRVCLPAILESGSIEQRALGAYMAPVSARGLGAIGATEADKAWRLGSMAEVSVVAWSDGSCSVSIGRGDAAELSSAVRAALAARSEGFVEGQTAAVDSGRGVRTAYCTPQSPPVVVGVTTPAPHTRRPALVATIFRARGAFSACAPAAVRRPQ
jgi:hypothetical protein